MSGIIVLDSGPLWLACLALGKPDADRCRRWIDAMLARGYLVILPEIADYETRREFIRRGANASLARLDDLKARLAYRPITTEAMIRAAQLWADVRTLGTPTAHPEALDGDCIVAAQAMVESGPGIVAIVATTNANHLARSSGIDADSGTRSPDRGGVWPYPKGSSQIDPAGNSGDRDRAGPDLAWQSGQVSLQDNLGVDRPIRKRGMQ